jgi:MFS family permease
MDGAVYFVFGVYLGPMAEEMGWSRGATSAAFSLFVAVMGLSGPVVALLIERFGLKRIMLIGEMLIVAGLLLISVVQEIWHLYLIYGVLVGFARACASYMAMTGIVNNWFVRRRSLAMGISIAGSGIGTVTMAPLSRYLIGTVGWRESWMVMAAVAFVFALVPTLILAREKPEDMGLQPDGVSPRDAENGQSKRIAPADWSVKQALKTRALWCIGIIVVAKYFALQMMATHQVVHLEDMGISPIVAASALGLLVAGASVGMLVAGALGQLFQLRYVATVACTMEMVGLIVLLFAKSLPMVYVYVFLFGPGYGALAILFPTMVGAYFGRKCYALIFGMLLAAGYVIGATSPIIAGFVFDTTGSYVVPFGVATGVCALSALAAYLAKPPVLRDFTSH